MHGGQSLDQVGECYDAAKLTGFPNNGKMSEAVGSRKIERFGDFGVARDTDWIRCHDVANSQLVQHFELIGSIHEPDEISFGHYAYGLAMLTNYSAGMLLIGHGLDYGLEFISRCVVNLGPRHELAYLHPCCPCFELLNWLQGSISGDFTSKCRSSRSNCH